MRNLWGQSTHKKVGCLCPLNYKPGPQQIYLKMSPSFLLETFCAYCAHSTPSTREHACALIRFPRQLYRLEWSEEKVKYHCVSMSKDSMSKICCFVCVNYFVVFLFGFVFVTRDFKMQWFPRLGRDNRVKGRCFGFFSQEPHPMKLKPGGVVFLGLCGIHSTNTDTCWCKQSYLHCHCQSSSRNGESKVPRGQNWKYKWQIGSYLNKLSGDFSYSVLTSEEWKVLENYFPKLRYYSLNLL